MIKLLAVDMDGTCLDGRSRITDNTIRALREAARAGITVVPATGRNLYCLPHRLAEGTLYDAPSKDAEKNRGLFRYVISSNGARVTDIQERKTLFQAMIPEERAVSLLKQCTKTALCTASHISCRYLIQGRIPALAGRILYGRDAKGVYCVRDMVQTVNRSPFPAEELQFYFHSRRARKRLEKIIDSYPDLTAAYTSVYVEVFSKEASKGRALEVLAKNLDVRKDEIACIGDGENDLSMFQASGLKISMGNAADSLKEQADYVTSSNRRGGAAAAIRRILSENY